ncbi:MAG: phosphoribosylglycinamide formyltransferase [Elusimicrobia bacterium]|nr:phosphoribosylglycinamide formyltransferase [Elusimicrobiota bacterium]
MPKIGIGVLVSGGGSNFQALAEAARKGEIPGGEVRLVVSNRPGAGALVRAKALEVEALVFEPKDFASRAAYYERIGDEFKKRSVRLVCLAGFLMKVEPNFIRMFPGRILNIHPALLPRYGGKGMYGRFVHEAVIKSGDAESGCTVHVVDEEFDHGPILRQARVPVLPGDTPESLAARVLVEEHRIYPTAVKPMIEKLLATTNEETVP